MAGGQGQRSGQFLRCPMVWQIDQKPFSLPLPASPHPYSGLTENSPKAQGRKALDLHVSAPKVARSTTLVTM